ncbi:MAG: CHAP domain-containing protein [Steroidobacter sp.]
MPTYPGVILRRGHSDAAAVRAVQRRLKVIGYGPFPRAGVFDAATEASIRLFQAQHVDSLGIPLKVDGRIGPFTWGALFPTPSSPAPTGASSSLSLQALAVAASQIGVREQPEGSNSGPQVDRYLASVGVTPRVGPAANRAWCAAFVYWCYQTASRSLGAVNPVVKTGGVLRHWDLARANASAKRHRKQQAIQDPGLVKPGFVFVYDFGRGLGHTGIVERLDNGRLITIEGNIDDAKTPGREGVGVFRTERRKITDKLLVGFVEY